MSFNRFGSSDLVLEIDSALSKCGCKDQRCADRCMHYENGNLPDYSNECVRYAYIPRYLFPHVSEIRKSLILHHQAIQAHVGPLQAKENLICIGCGPGSDMFGFCDWMELAGGVNELKVGILDRGKWKDQQELVKNYGRWPFKVDPIRMSTDFFNALPSNISNLPAKFFSASFFISEVSDSVKDTVLGNFAQLIGGNKCVLIVNDRPEARVLGIVKELAMLLKAETRFSTFTDFPKGANKHSEKWAETFMEPENLKEKYKWQTTCGSFQCVMLVN